MTGALTFRHSPRPNSPCSKKNHHMTTKLSLQKEYTLGGELKVRRMGFGAMRITGQGIWGPPKDKAEAIRVLRRAVELGVNFIDNADSYGPHVSEDLIAEALYPYPKGLVIATKGGFLRTGPNQWHVNSRPEHLREALESSLARLKQDQIHLYQLHRIDPTIPFQRTLEFLQGVQEEGLVKYIGLSEVSVEEIKKAEEYVDIVSVQNKYSQDYRKWESVLHYCEETDKAFIPWNPINAGNLTNMSAVDRVAGKIGATPHQVALAWLLYHSSNNLLIPGTSSVKHLEENIAAENIELTEELLEQLEK